MRTDVVFNNGSQWQKKDVIKLVTVSIIMLHYIDISNGVGSPLQGASLPCRLV